MPRIAVLLVLSYISLATEASLAQAFMGQSLFASPGGPSRGNSLTLNAGDGSDDRTLGLKAGYLLGDYQFSLQHRTSNLDFPNWPKRLVQSNLSVGRMFEQDYGRMLMVTVGAGVSSEHSDSVNSYAEPSGQVMYMAPPEGDASWGYGAGLMMLPNSSIGRFPVPMLVAMYTNGDNFRLSAGIPMISMNYIFGDDNSLDVAVGLFGVQRIAVKRDLSAALRTSLVYKQDRSFYNHIEGWNEDQLFNHTSEKTGIEIEYEVSEHLRAGIEAGHLIKQNLKRVEPGFNGSTVFEEKVRGGFYLQLASAFSF
jgi:hypothetical protein